MGIQVQPCCCDTELPPIEGACDLCSEGVPAIFNISFNRGTDLNRNCSDCNDLLDTLTDIPVAYQGTTDYDGATYHEWRSAEDILDSTDCSSVFDDHVFTVLLRTEGSFCWTWIFFHLSSEHPSEVGIGEMTDYAASWTDSAISTLCVGDQEVFSSSANVYTMNCWNPAFGDSITLHL